MGNTPFRNTVFFLPDKIRKDIDSLVDEGRGAIWIIKAIKEKYVGAKLPCTPAVNRYVHWRREKIEEARKFNPSLNVELTPPVISPDGQVNLDESDPLENLDLNSGKDTLDVIKEKIRTRIMKLEASTDDSTEVDKNVEQLLQKYYEILRQLTHSVVELSPDLKGGDTVTIGEVKNELTKLFSIVRRVVNSMIPDRRMEFMQKLDSEIKVAKSVILEAASNEPLDIECNKESGKPIEGSSNQQTQPANEQPAGVSSGLPVEQVIGEIKPSNDQTSLQSS